MVAPEALERFVKLMNSSGGFQYGVYIDDVQSLIERETIGSSSSRSLAKDEFGWTRYHTLNEIYDWLDVLVKNYPDRIVLLSVGKTYEGRQIKGVKLSFASGNESRPGVFIEGGIHAREWISTATVTYLLNEFLTSNEPEIRELAEKYDWYMFPTFNPDGYVYTHTTVFKFKKYY